jgi:hypothetical protein
MERVLGIGGYFMRAADPVALSAWYRDCLGLDADENGLWHQEAGPTVFAAFESEADYFGSRAQPETRNPALGGISAKRLIGFEPTTFCMAIRPISGPARQKIWLFAGISQRHYRRSAIGNACGYTPICSHSGTRARECPKFEVTVSFWRRQSKIGTPQAS